MLRATTPTTSLTNFSVRAAHLAVRAPPKAKTPLIRLDLSKIHKPPVPRTTDTGDDVSIRVFSPRDHHEVSIAAVIAYRAAGCRAEVARQLFQPAEGWQNLTELHPDVVLIAKWTKIAFMYTVPNSVSRLLFVR